jgi:carbamate kinase
VKLVVALGGNALLRRSQLPSAGNQQGNVRLAATQLARVAQAHTLLLTHGNGPQVGLLALQAAAYTAVEGYPLDLLDAQTQGMLGYLLEQELANRLPPERAVVTLLTRVEVDRADPAFGLASKPIGPVYTQAQAQQQAEQHRWTMGADGAGFRRLVPSPRPLRVPVLQTLRRLLDGGALVIAAGGGGIPVVRRADGAGMEGVEAVIDKDLCSALLATALDADCLVIATDVSALCLNWGEPNQRALGHTTPGELARHAFAAGSMAPKVEAVCNFVRATGRRAVIGPLDRIEAMLAGTAGTQVHADALAGPARRPT